MRLVVSPIHEQKSKASSGNCMPLWNTSFTARGGEAAVLRGCLKPSSWKTVDFFLEVNLQHHMRAFESSFFNYIVF